MFLKIPKELYNLYPVILKKIIGVCVRARVCAHTHARGRVTVD